MFDEPLDRESLPGHITKHGGGVSGAHERSCTGVGGVLSIMNHDHSNGCALTTKHDAEVASVH